MIFISVWSALVVREAKKLLPVPGDVISGSASGNTIAVSASHPSATLSAASSVESATTLRTQSQAQRPPSPADRDLLLSNTASGGPIAPAVPSKSKKLKLFDFMSTQPQRHEAPTNEQPDVSRDFQRLMNSSAVDLDVFNDPLFAISLRPIAMKLFCAPCSSAASERVFSQSGLIMRPTRSRLSPSTLAKLVFLKCNKNLR